MSNDIIEFLKFGIIILAIGLWVYILTAISDLINGLNIFPSFVVGLTSLLLIMIGSLYIIIKLRNIK